MEEIRKLLEEELGSSKMEQIEQYVQGKRTRLSLASEIGSSYMDLVDVYMKSIKEETIPMAAKGK